jgi:hypothetical protein
MHDGSLATLDAVVDFYDKGGRPNPNLFPVLRPLNLTAEEKQALIKFLESLSGEVTSTVLPRERTSPDFSGTWTPAAATTSASPAPLWSGGPVIITQRLASLLIQTRMQSDKPQSVIRVYNLTGSVQRITDRTRPAGHQNVTTQSSWRDWQLVLTAAGFLPDGEGTPIKEEITQVLTLESPSTLTVQITRQGARTENWTVKLQRAK